MITEEMPEENYDEEGFPRDEHDNAPEHPDEEEDE